MCRTHHAQIRERLEDLQGAADGAWAILRKDSSEIVVVGDVIDPVPLNRVTCDTNSNKIVALYEESDLVKIVIQLGHEVHKSLHASQQSMQLLQLDEAITKQELGLC